MCQWIKVSSRAGRLVTHACVNVGISAPDVFSCLSILWLSRSRFWPPTIIKDVGSRRKRRAYIGGYMGIGHKYDRTVNFFGDPKMVDDMADEG